MAVQFAVAFSKLVYGAGVYEGQPYNCATHYFPHEVLLASTSLTQYTHDSCQNTQCTASEMAPICYGCPSNATIELDHCKSHPEIIDLDVLASDITDYASRGLIDDPKNLNSSRIHLFQGTKDDIYMPGTTKKTLDLFAKFMPMTNIKYDTQPVEHGWPQRFTLSGLLTPGIRITRDYDVVEHTLQHIYSALEPPSNKIVETSLHEFDQSPYDVSRDNEISGFDKTGRVYIPAACADGRKCRLHVVFHGCGGSKSRNEQLVRSLSTNRWAEANGIVVLWPFLKTYAAPPANHHGGGCWDVYGASERFAWKSSNQMSSVAKMIEALSGSYA